MNFTRSNIKCDQVAVILLPVSLKSERHWTSDAIQAEDWIRSVQNTALKWDSVEQTRRLFTLRLSLLSLGQDILSLPSDPPPWFTWFPIVRFVRTFNSITGFYIFLFHASLLLVAFNSWNLLLLITIKI